MDFTFQTGVKPVLSLIQRPVSILHLPSEVPRGLWIKAVDVNLLTVVIKCMSGPRHNVIDSASLVIGCAYRVSITDDTNTDESIMLH